MILKDTLIIVLKVHLQFMIGKEVNFIIKKLSSIFTVGTLQLNDFLQARRGVENYLNDLVNKQVSYREYKINKRGYKIVKKNLKLDKRDKFEFYYHIVKNLILNYAKFIYRENNLFKLSKIIKKFIYF